MDENRLDEYRSWTKVNWTKIGLDKNRIGRKKLDENRLDENRLDENWAHGVYPISYALTCLLTIFLERSGYMFFLVWTSILMPQRSRVANSRSGFPRKGCGFPNLALVTRFAD